MLKTHKYDKFRFVSDSFLSRNTLSRGKVKEDDNEDL